MFKNKIEPINDNISNKCKYLIELSLNQNMNNDNSSNNSNSSNPIIIFTQQNYNEPIVQTMVETNNNINIQPIIIPHNKFTYDYIFNNFCSKSENSGCCTGCCYDEKYNINNTYRSRGDCCEDICPECCSTF